MLVDRNVAGAGQARRGQLGTVTTTVTSKSHVALAADQQAIVLLLDAQVFERPFGPAGLDAGGRAGADLDVQRAGNVESLEVADFEIAIDARTIIFDMAAVGAIGGHDRVEDLNGERSWHRDSPHSVLEH